MHINSGSVLVALINQEKRKVVVGREPGKRDPIYWKLLGGRIKDNETPHEAAVREIKEESSIDLTNLDLTLVSETPLTGPSGPYVQYLFVVAVPYELISRHDGNIIVCIDDEGDKLESTCIDFNELETMHDFMPKHRKMLELLRPQT